jgi:hypothetical protein
MTTPGTTKRRRGARQLVAVVLALAVSAAGAAAAQTPAIGAAGPPAAKTHSSRPEGVAWFEGDPAAAFALAQSTQRQVLLYWGAVWCPPCQELKATIFKRPDFLDRLKLFIPVYLDGDAPGAQAWGERFHVSGYPTLLVLRADQTELERVSGGMDLSRYAEVLDLALGQDRPVRELLAAVAGQEAMADPDDCRRLAYNAWWLDDDWLSHPESLEALAAQLDRAAQRCAPVPGVERARLQLTAVHAAVRAQAKELGAGKPADAQLRALVRPVPRILADGELALQLGDVLCAMPAEFFPAAAAAYGRPGKPGKDALRARWILIMNQLAADPRYSASDRLDAVRSKLLAAKALGVDGKIATPLAAAVTRRIDDELARERDPYARASLVNSALNLLDVLGDDARAHAILDGEIRTAEHPYYYMEDMGELEEKLGHADLAVDWLARSYQSAQGPATRFQWGVSYVQGLLRMHPQEETAIRSAALSVLGELDAADDLHGRNLRSLRRLEAALREWNRDASHDAAIGELRARVQSICGRLAPGDSSRPACAAFLAKA